MTFQNDFIIRVLKTQIKLGQKVFSGNDKLNIVYVEGVNLDGTINGDEMNQWNDLRLVYKVVDDKPLLLDKWVATTEPGLKYTINPLNPGGAFRIAFGQYQAWSIGWHKDHEALVQVGEIKGHRDRNKDGFRTGDAVVTGSDFGVNQHWGYDMPEIDGASAGCLVGKSKFGHRQFMQIVKSDVRYQNDKNYVFWTAVLDGTKLEK
ncbi:MAG: hypothetical protein ACR2LR_04720 [Hassallia sp.]